MKKQIVVIHGGTTFESYPEYLKYLLTYELTLESFFQKDWKDNLQADLGDKYEVILPTMPNKRNAKYSEWKIWFEKFIPLIDNSVMLIGHSLGGIFLAKYLSENIFPKKIIATFLVAAPYNDNDRGIGHQPADFVLPEDISKLQTQGGKIHLYHSKDDGVVPFSDFETYRKHIPDAHFHYFEDRGHFNGPKLKELVEEIKN